MADSLEAITRDVVACAKCPRLVAWREQAARERPRLRRDLLVVIEPAPAS